MENSKKENKLFRIFSGSLFYGIIINFIILVIVDGGRDLGYIFLLVISIFLGWLVSYAISYFENKKTKYKT